jgi:uncharacterized protein YqeY
MSLKQQVESDMKAALKAGESRLGTLRLLLAAIKDREISERTSGERVSLDDAQVLAVIDKMIKQRQDSIEQFQNAGRKDLAEKEQDEIKVLQNYLPPQLNEAEVQKLIQEAIASTGAASMKDMGKVMAQLKPQLQGRTDMSAVSGKLKDMLNK